MISPSLKDVVTDPFLLIVLEHFQVFSRSFRLWSGLHTIYAILFVKQPHLTDVSPARSKFTGTNLCVPGVKFNIHCRKKGSSFETLCHWVPISCILLPHAGSCIFSLLLLREHPFPLITCLRDFSRSFFSHVMLNCRRSVVNIVSWSLYCNSLRECLLKCLSCFITAFTSLSLSLSSSSQVSQYKGGAPKRNSPCLK